MNPNNKDTYLVTLTCSLESSTPMVINCTPYEINLLNFIANLSAKLSKEDLSRPFLTIQKFPYDEYKKRKLSSLEQQEFKRILNENKKCYTKIKKEVVKKLKQGNN